MQKKATLGIVALTVAALGGVASVSQAKIMVPVVAGATALAVEEKGGVNGEHCGCQPHDLKPGYGFGTTGHYGPPGQGFTTHNSWRMVVQGGGTTTPKGGDLPPRAFK